MYREGHCLGGFYEMTAQLLAEDGSVRFFYYTLNTIYINTINWRGKEIYICVLKAEKHLELYQINLSGYNYTLDIQFVLHMTVSSMFNSLWHILYFEA